MTDTPLINKKVHDDHASFFVNKKGVLLKDVQSAKRLCYYEVKSALRELIPNETSCYWHEEIEKAIDRAFNIPDGSDEEAKE